jgi:hypothetical protein
MTRFEFNVDPLDEMEDVLGVFYGGRGQWGQQFVVTNRRLLLGPLDVGIALEIDAYVLDQALPGTGAGGLLKSVLNQYAPKKPKTLWLRHVLDVQPTNDASVFRAPGVRITTDTEQLIDIRIVKTTKTPNGRSENNVVRDRAVLMLRRAVADAKAAHAATP